MPSFAEPAPLLPGVPPCRSAQRPLTRPAALAALLCGALFAGHALAQADAGTPIPPSAASAKAQECANCHGDLAAGKLRAPVKAVRKDVHGARKLGCTACHGGDGASKDAKVAHAGTFLGRPSSHEAVAAMCGRCHAAPVENWSKGPHHLAKSTDLKPDCVTCHGAHGIGTVTIDLISDEHCSKCHTADRARRIFKAAVGAERSIAALDKELASAGHETEARATLHAARTKLRGLAHQLDLLTITRNAAEALSVVDEVRAKALPHLGARSWAKLLQKAGLAILAFLLLALVGFIVLFVWRRRHHLPTLTLPRSGPALALTGVGVLIVAAGAVGSMQGFKYVEHDPKFCTSCHTMGSAYDLWEKSAHNKIECHTCHLADPVANLHQLWVYTTQRPDVVVKHAQIDHSICEKCHTGEGNRSKWNNIAETPGHRLHAGKNHVECVQCHAVTAHRFVPPTDVCLSCHKQITLKAAGTMAEMHCLQCHNFKAVDPAKQLTPDRATCLDCHEQRRVGEEIFPEKAPMKWACGRCHRPHEKISPTIGDCKKCHLGVDEGIHKIKAHENCLDCHKPHGWSTEPASCKACHKGKEQHNPGKACSTCHGAYDPE